MPDPMEAPARRRVTPRYKQEYEAAQWRITRVRVRVSMAALAHGGQDGLCCAFRVRFERAEGDLVRTRALCTALEAHCFNPAGEMSVRELENWAGFAAEEVSVAEQVDSQAVRKLRRLHGFDPDSGELDGALTTAELAMLDDVRRGRPLRAIAEAHGCSAMKVSRFVNAVA
jgi:hypothetical protein